MDKNVLIVSLLVIAVIGIGSFAFMFTPKTSSFTDKLSYTGVACVQKISSKGVVTDYGCQHNLVTTKGLEMVKRALNGTVGNWNLTNLTVGGNTSALATSDTDLAGMANCSAGNLTPIAATYARIGNGNSSLNYAWVANATVECNATGIYNLTGAGTNLFAEASWSPSSTLQSGDILNLTYYWWIS